MLNGAVRRTFAKQIFVWGTNHNNLAFAPRSVRHTDFPQRLPYDFLTDGAKAVSGFSETVFWGEQGVFSSGVKHVFSKNELSPVKFGAIEGHSVVEADVDKSHALFLTEDGTVHQTSDAGEKLAAVELPGAATKIAAGDGVSLAVLSAQNGAEEVYIWGATSFGRRAVFLDPRVSEVRRPQPLKALNKVLRSEGSPIKKLRMVGTSAVLLLENGQLVSWGDNSNGNLGVPRSELSLVDDFVYNASFPLRLARLDCRATDFELSDNVLIVLLDDGQAAFAGINGTLKLRVLDFVEDAQVRAVGCCHNRYFLLASDGRVFSNKNFEAEQFVKFFGDLELYQLDGKYFEGRALESIAGKYDNFVAVGR